uniref:ERM domain-containing protein n=1 Tax=Heterorhabditis bacteriophora TaxID=37862 RepID=A0A1I7XMQ6_HETBA
MSAREQAEARQREAEDRMRRMQEDMERAKRELIEAQNTIHNLETQLRQLQLVRDKQYFYISYQLFNFRLVVGQMIRYLSVYVFIYLELTNDADQHVPQRELERITAAEQNLNIKTKLELLTRELEGVKDERGVTDYDVLHMENKRAGRDKYKTLRQIRGGNTKRRIDQYENIFLSNMIYRYSIEPVYPGNLSYLCMIDIDWLFSFFCCERGRTVFYNIHKKVTDPAKQDPEYFEKEARKLPLDNHYIDALNKLYYEKIGSERDLGLKGADNLVSDRIKFGLPDINGSAPRFPYKNLDILQNAPGSVKKIFSIAFGTRRDHTTEWKAELIDKVNQHSLDNSSLEMRSDLSLLIIMVLSFVRGTKLKGLLVLEGKATDVVGQYEPSLIEGLSETVMHSALFYHPKPTMVK